MDMLIVGTQSESFKTPLTVSQSRCQFSVWSALKSPLLVSADFTNVNVTPAMIDVLKNTEVLAVSDDPLGREAVRLEDQTGSTSVGEIYAGPLANGSYVVVFFNRYDKAANMSLHLADVVPQSLGASSSLSSSSMWAVRDLWAHADNGTVASDGHIDLTIPPEDVVMIKLTPSTNVGGAHASWALWW